MERDWNIYRCVACHEQSIRASLEGDHAECHRCVQSYSLQHNILDTLVQPSDHVIRELRGTACEAGWDADRWRDVKLDRPSKCRDLAMRLAESEKQPGQYYQQITANFQQAMQHIELLARPRVLEIGAEYDYWFLKHFRDCEAECHAVNIHFIRPNDNAHLDWPEKTLADMNDLPFVDGTFDIVLLSATSHHSPTLDTLVAEVARVLKPGGCALFLSDPLSGWLKRLGGRLDDHRNTEINENEYTFRRYDRLFKQHGLSPQYLFSAYYDDILRGAAVPSRRRFARVGRLLSPLWRVSFVRSVVTKRLLRSAHTVFGFPLNAIVRKES